MSSESYYKVGAVAEPGKWGTADVPELNFADLRPLRQKDRTGGKVESWEEWEYRLKDGGFADYQNDTGGFRLCSERLRAVLDALASPKDVLQWLPVWVTAESGERRRYWILHFPEQPDLLDWSQTEMLGPVIGRAALDSRKTEGHKIMPSPDGRRRLFVVLESVRAVLQEQGLTGMEFRRFPS